MTVLVEAALFLGGLAILVLGADRSVTAAAELARFYGVSPFFVGVTVVSIGTSVPEMTTSVYAALYGAGDILVGNIIGSETAQITLAIGVVALVAPIVAERRNVMVYGGAMVLAMVIMLLVVEDGAMIRSEGLLMMLSYVFFVYTLYTNEGGREVGEGVIDQERPTRAVPMILWGLGLVVVGGHLMVSNGVALARVLGVSELLVGVLTGLGTTTPEIVVASLAGHRGRSGISVGALLGSNITDPVFSLGVGALVTDVAVENVAAMQAAATYMLVVSLVVLAAFYLRRGIDRATGVVCIALYLPSFALL